VWVITSHRDSDTLERFIGNFVDRPAAEDRGDEQLMLRPLVEREPVDFQMTSSTTTEDVVGWLDEAWGWEPAITLTHSIQRGLSRPWRAFSLFNLPSSRADLLGASIEFTPDGEVALGVEARTKEEAIAWLAHLAADFDASLGLVTEYTVGSRGGAEALIADGKAHYHWRR
jgi:hypothetical protein